jgi:hypothetical protein
MHMNRMLRATSLGVLLMTAFVAPASAAAPSNDAIGSPRLVTGIPYSDGPYDTTEATTGATDPDCFGGPDRSTVWYSFTPGTSGRFAADTFGSNYDTTLQLGTPNGSGGIDIISCNDDAQDLQSRVAWDATDGTTYLLAVGTCCGDGVVGQAGGGGSLTFHVDVAPPAPSASITLDRTGSFNSAGVATIHGTIACTNTDFVDIMADASQRVGRRVLRGFGETITDCASGRWSLDITSGDGKYLGGSLSVRLDVNACNRIECAFTSVEGTVRLKR